MRDTEFEELVTKGVMLTLEQGEACSLNGKCFYRLGEKRCAVGHMMTDEEVEKFGDLEGNVHSINLGRNGWQTNLTVDQLYFLSKIQSAHDGLEDCVPANFKMTIRREILEIIRVYGMDVMPNLYETLEKYPT